MMMILAIHYHWVYQIARFFSFSLLNMEFESFSFSIWHIAFVSIALLCYEYVLSHCYQNMIV